MNIIWSPESIEDLKAIYLYIAAENPSAARTLHTRIKTSVLMLAKTPQIGRAGRVPGTRESVISGTSYIVPYRVMGETLQILRIYHSARQWPADFGEI